MRPTVYISATVGLVTAGAIVAYLLHRRSRSKRSILAENLQRKLTVGKDGVTFRLIENTEDWKRHKQEFFKNIVQSKILGLDCEWVSNNKIALLQIAGTTGYCFLFRLNKLKSVLPELQVVLQDDSILKFGVGIREDAAKMAVDYPGAIINGTVDIRFLVKAYKPDQPRMGLAGLTKTFLGFDLDKNWRIRAGNWEADELTQRQLAYAVNDALVAVNIAEQIAITYLATNPFVAYTIDDILNLLYHECIPYKDQRYKDKPVKNSGKKNNNFKRAGSPQKKDVTRALPLRKTPLYHNVRLEAPDGQALCVCDYKKACWYVKRNLGTVVSEEPFVVRLNFEPAGRPEGTAGEYYLNMKENICVVCGKKDSYLRKYIVPHEYRKHFPTVMRDHQSHDILLMCVQCHQTSNLHDLQLRRTLAAECNAPIGTEEDIKVREDFDLKKVKSACRALKKNGDSIPDDRQKELEEIIKAYYNVTEVNDEILEKGSNLESMIANVSYDPHGKKVVQWYLENGGIIPLEKRWRKHFLNTMKPRHLPELWSIDHQQERLDVKAAENRIDMTEYKLATEGIKAN